jgi:parallel beta-helix repeat protein
MRKRMAFSFWLTVSWFALLPLMVLGQGPLIPPGAPGPTMKTLEQIEPRIPITNLPYTISSAGSYYVTANLVSESRNGIIVSNDNVSIDLMGYTLSGDSGSGIYLAGVRHNVSVVNGTLSGWSVHGVYANNDQNCRFQTVRSRNNGVDGFSLGEECEVVDCASVGNGDAGFISSGGKNRFFQCKANGNHSGFYLQGDGNELRQCSAVTNIEGCGIRIEDRGIVDDCHVYGNNLDGIQVDGFCKVTGNVSEYNGSGAHSSAASIKAVESGNVIEKNICMGCDYGLSIDGTNNLVAGNLVQGNADNYVIANGNFLNLLLSEIPESIDWPASVKLAGTLTGAPALDGITINADDITIDLNGFALVGSGGDSGNGITQSASRRNLAVRNGFIVNWFGSGKFGIQALGYNNRMEGLQLATNYNGLWSGPGALIGNCSAFDHVNEDPTDMYLIYGGPDSVIQYCSVFGNKSYERIYGIWGATVIGCSAYSNSAFARSVGIRGRVVTACSAQHNTGSSQMACGIQGEAGSVISDCRAYDNVNGFIVGDGSTVINCSAVDNDSDGIYLGYDCLAKNNTCATNGSAGIYAVTGNRIEGNLVAWNYYGIDVLGSNNFIVCNVARNNSSTNYNNVAVDGNIYGPITSSMTNQPWANFQF